jgi:hypothetical protein
MTAIGIYDPTDMPLKHRLLATLSLASSRGYPMVPLTRFFEIFADLSERFPEAFPKLYFDRTPWSAYSKQLDGALQSLIGLCVEILPSLNVIEVSHTSAVHLIERLKESYGEGTVEAFSPVATALGEYIDRHQTSGNQPGSGARS